VTGSPRRHLTLPDGRTVAYVEFGDLDGTPVLHHHGGLVSASDVAPMADVLAAAGVRLICADRPGIGESSPMPGRTILDGAADANSLLDHLGIDRVRVLGWSMGGQYALATAYALGDRVERAAVVAGCLPLDDPETLAELNTMDRRYTDWAAKDSRALPLAFEAGRIVSRMSPKTWARLASAHEGQRDEDAVRAAAEALAASASDAMVDLDGAAEEYRAWARPWGFTLADVAVPIDVWQGTIDHLVPEQWAHRMAAELGQARLHIVPDAGHFLPLTHMPEIAAALLD
jgi:pimeloyl-ACP methyl ester carboxylesterase